MPKATNSPTSENTKPAPASEPRIVFMAMPRTTPLTVSQFGIPIGIERRIDAKSYQQPNQREHQAGSRLRTEDRVYGNAQDHATHCQPIWNSPVEHIENGRGQ